MTDVSAPPPPAVVPVNGAPVPPVESTKSDPLPLLEIAAERHADLAKLVTPTGINVADADYVHDVRVASRRLGEVARLMTRSGELFDKPSAKAVEASLRALRKSMGDLRDADVTVEHLRKWRMPAALKKLAGSMAEAHAGERPELEKAAAEQLASASLAGTMVILARALEQPAGAAAEVERRLEKALDGLIRKREKQLRQAFGKAAQKQSPAALHEARIAVKKLRYLWELAEPFTRGAGKKVKTLKKFQELLGDHHDVHVIEEQMAKEVAKPQGKAGRATGAAWRKWHREMEKAQAKRAGEFFMQSYAWLNE